MENKTFRIPLRPALGVILVVSLILIAVWIYSFISNPAQSLQIGFVMLAIIAVVATIIIGTLSRQYIEFNETTISFQDSISKRRVRITYDQIKLCGFSGSKSFPFLSVETNDSKIYSAMLGNFHEEQIAEMDSKLRTLPSYSKE